MDFYRINEEYNQYLQRYEIEKMERVGCREFI